MIYIVKIEGISDYLAVRDPTFIDYPLASMKTPMLMRYIKHGSLPGASSVEFQPFDVVMLPDSIQARILICYSMDDAFVSQYKQAVEEYYGTKS